MEVLGWVFLAVIALTVLLGLFWLVRSVPDIRRYQRIRGM